MKDGRLTPEERVELIELDAVDDVSADRVEKVGVSAPR